MKSILVIDDNPDIRENTAEILDLAGYKTYTAENGKKGIEVAQREKPDKQAKRPGTGKEEDSLVSHNNHGTRHP